MTKRWSSTRSDLTATKRQASKDLRQQLKRADARPPEASFDNVDDMLKWLDGSCGEEAPGKEG